MRSSVVVQGGGSQCLLVIIRLCKKRKSGGDGATRGYYLVLPKRKNGARFVEMDFELICKEARFGCSSEIRVIDCSK